MEIQVRQGDVFLRKVEALPEDAQRVQIQEPAGLAYGEVTGHKHQVLDTTIERYQIHDGRSYILLEQAGVLTHEEHGLATLEPGVYELIIERDFDPSEYQRPVVD